jgi:hypothetical protein
MNVNDRMILGGVVIMIAITEDDVGVAYLLVFVLGTF